MNLKIALSVIVAASAMPLLGQNTVVSFSTMVHTADAAAGACFQQRAIVAQVIDRFPHPAKWTWIVACDEISWRFLQSQTHLPLAPETAIMALTDLTAGRSFIRGYYILHPLDSRDVARADRIVAHELGHIFLHSADEMRVAGLSGRWFRDRDTIRIAASDPSLR